jgi:hypothetical protein
MRSNGRPAAISAPRRPIQSRRAELPAPHSPFHHGHGRNRSEKAPLFQSVGMMGGRRSVMSFCR